MSTKINQQENIKNEEIKALPDENMNLMNEAYKKFNSIIYNNEELNKFKDNILSILKERDKIYLQKLTEYKAKAEKIKIDFDLTNKLTNSKFSKIIDTQAQLSSRLDQLNNYETFVTKTNDKLISHEVRLTNIREDFSLATQKYDKIYLDNLELPGYIGRCAKYKNCQIFFLEVIKDLAKLNKYREKNIIDLKMYKEKLETIISSMNSILDNNNQSQIKYINETKDKILKDCNNMFESVCENMKEIRVENSKYAVDLISQSMDLNKKWDKIEKIKDDLLEKFNYSVNKYQMLTDDTIKSFEEFKTEYSIIRRKFMELAEFIKDVRFRKNIGENVKKKEIKVMVKKMLRKRKSFDGKDVHLLNDISNIENIDYKKYYNVETRNDDIINENNDNRSKTNQNKNEKKNKYQESHKTKKNYSISKESLYKRDLNQSADEKRPNRINLKNPLTSKSNINNNIDPSTQSINITPINLKNVKSSINNANNSAIVSSRNLNIKKEANIDIKYSINEKNNEKKNKKEYYDKNKTSKEKIKGSNKVENLKEKNNESYNNDNLKNNMNNNKEINKEINSNINNANQNINLKDEQIKSEQNSIIENNLKLQENIQVKERTNNLLDNNNIEEKNIDNNKFRENSEIRLIHNNSTNNQQIEISNNQKENIIVNNEDISLNNIKSYRSYRSNFDIKPSIIDDSSSVSDGYNLNSAKDIKNNTIGLSSEKSLSFISDNNNINKFLINDIPIVNNDKIIKELASELEQSTAKKDKLASNKKEIEQKFKNACSNIEPINLLAKKEDKQEISSNPNINISNKDINNNNSNNNLNNNNNYNNEFKNQNNIQKYNSEKPIINNNREYNENINNNIELESKKINNDYRNINNNNRNNESINDNDNDNDNDVPPTKTTEEGNNNINSINCNNKNERENSSIIEEDKIKNINYINKSINKPSNNLNPIKMNNEININEGFNSNTFNKKLHAVDQKLLNLELYTKEKILDLIEQINLIKNNCKMPINDSLIKEKSILESNKISSLPNTTSSNKKYKTFNNSFLNNSNINNQQNSFYIEKNKENIQSNNNNSENNSKNIYNINSNNNNSNPQYFYNNINLDKKRYSLKEINQKSSLLGQKLSKKGNINALNYNSNTNTISNSNNSIVVNNIIQNNSLTENNNGLIKHTSRNGNIKEILDSNNNIIQNLNEINNKYLKEIESKIKNGNALKNYNNDDLCNKSSNKSLNHGSNRNSFAYSNSTFNGTEIKLVDLNKLVNHQLPKNRLVPIRINDNDYFVSLNSK